MADNYIVTDDDLTPSQPATRASSPGNYIVTDDDLMPALSAASTSQPSSALTSMPSVALAPALFKGVGQLGVNANKELTQGVNKLFGTSLISPSDPFNYSNDSKLGQLEAQNPTTTAFGNFLGRMAPQLLTNPTTFGGSLASGAAFGALNDLNHPVLGSLIGGGFGAAAGGTGAGANYLANAIKSGLNSEVNQAADRLGLQGLPLGEATRSPLLKDLSQNRLPGIPGSGAANNYANLGSQLDQKAQDAISSIRPNTPVSQIPKNIQKAFRDTAQHESDVKDAMYQNHADYMRSIGANANVNDALSVADNLQATNPDAYNKINPIMSQLRGPIDAGTGFRDGADFGDASLAAGQLNQLTRKYAQSPDPFVRANAEDVTSVRDTLVKGMNDSTNATNDPNAKGLWQKAQNNYRDNYSQFLDPDVARYLARGSKANNPDLLISNFLKTGKNNQPTLLNKLLSKVPDNQKNDIGYYFLTNSLPRNEAGSPILNTTTVTKFNNSLQNYDPQIRNQLIPANVQQTLKDVHTVRDQIPDLLLNPPTGQKLNNAATWATIGGPAAGLAWMGHPGLAAGYVGSMLAGGRLAHMALTSPKLKNLLGGNLNFIPKTSLLSAIGNTGVNSFINGQ